MKRWIAGLLFVVGCDNPGTDVPISTETDETDVVIEDTGAFTYDSDPETDIVETDDDTGLPPPEDTAACKFGDSPDCDGNCFPSWMVGDGECDDGSRWPANFFCEQHRFDEGDCEGQQDTDSGDTGGDTDVPLPSGCGRFELELHLGQDAVEVGWRVERVLSRFPFLERVRGVDPGAYTLDNGVYKVQLFLPPDRYQFVGVDSFGDGWQGGYYILRDLTTNQAVVRSTPTLSSTGARAFTVSCDLPPQCDIDVVSLGGAQATETAWELYTNADVLVARRGPGELTPGATLTDRVALYEGTYTARLRDVRGNGWADSRIELRYAGGLLARAQGLASGGSGSVDVPLQCALANQSAFDAPGDPLQPVQCDNMVLGLRELGSDPGDISWTLFRVDDWTIVSSRVTGSYSTNPSGSRTNVVNLRDGLYYMNLVDSESDGWEQARLRLEDPGDDNAILTTFTLPAGPGTGRYFAVDCAEPTVDTDPAPVDSDTDLPEPTCFQGAVFDCAGICFLRSHVGDGNCDDGGFYAPDFDCEAWNFDGGDCATP